MDGQMVARGVARCPIWRPDPRIRGSAFPSLFESVRFSRSSDKEGDALREHPGRGDGFLGAGVPAPALVLAPSYDDPAETALLRRASGRRARKPGQEKSERKVITASL